MIQAVSLALRESHYGPDPACSRRAVPHAERRGADHRLAAKSVRPVPRSGRAVAPPRRFFLSRRDAVRSRAACAAAAYAGRPVAGAAAPRRGVCCGRHPIGLGLAASAAAGHRRPRPGDPLSPGHTRAARLWAALLLLLALEHGASMPGHVSDRPGRAWGL